MSASPRPVWNCSGFDIPPRDCRPVSLMFKHKVVVHRFPFNSILPFLDGTCNVSSKGRSHLQEGLVVVRFHVQPSPVTHNRLETGPSTSWMAPIISRTKSSVTITILSERYFSSSRSSSVAFLNISSISPSATVSIRTIRFVGWSIHCHQTFAFFRHLQDHRPSGSSEFLGGTSV
jgi:hypothetical protein